MSASAKVVIGFEFDPRTLVTKDTARYWVGCKRHDVQDGNYCSECGTDLYREEPIVSIEGGLIPNPLKRGFASKVDNIYSLRDWFEHYMPVGLHFPPSPVEPDRIFIGKRVADTWDLNRGAYIDSAEVEIPEAVEKARDKVAPDADIKVWLLGGYSG